MSDFGSFEPASMGQIAGDLGWNVGQQFSPLTGNIGSADAFMGNISQPLGTNASYAFDAGPAGFADLGNVSTAFDEANNFTAPQFTAPDFGGGGFGGGFTPPPVDQGGASFGTGQFGGFSPDQGVPSFTGQNMGVTDQNFAAGINLAFGGFDAGNMAGHENLSLAPQDFAGLGGATAQTEQAVNDWIAQDFKATPWENTFTGVPDFTGIAGPQKQEDPTGGLAAAGIQTQQIANVPDPREVVKADIAGLFEKDFAAIDQPYEAQQAATWGPILASDKLIPDQGQQFALDQNRYINQLASGDISAKEQALAEVQAAETQAGTTPTAALGASPDDILAIQAGKQPSTFAALEGAHRVGMSSPDITAFGQGVNLPTEPSQAAATAREAAALGAASGTPVSSPLATSQGPGGGLASPTSQVGPLGTDLQNVLNEAGGTGAQNQAKIGGATQYAGQLIPGGEPFGTTTETPVGTQPPAEGVGPKAPGGPPTDPSQPNYKPEFDNPWNTQPGNTYQNANQLPNVVQTSLALNDAQAPQVEGGSGGAPPSRLGSEFALHDPEISGTTQNQYKSSFVPGVNIWSTTMDDQGNVMPDTQRPTPSTNLTPDRRPGGVQTDLQPNVGQQPGDAGMVGPAQGYGAQALNIGMTDTARTPIPRARPDDAISGMVSGDTFTPNPGPREQPWMVAEAKAAFAGFNDPAGAASAAGSDLGLGQAADASVISGGGSKLFGVPIEGGFDPAALMLQPDDNVPTGRLPGISTDEHGRMFDAVGHDMGPGQPGPQTFSREGPAGHFPVQPDLQPNVGQGFGDTGGGVPHGQGGELVTPPGGGEPQWLRGPEQKVSFSPAGADSLAGAANVAAGSALTADAGNELAQAADPTNLAPITTGKEAGFFTSEAEASTLKPQFGPNFPFQAPQTDKVFAPNTGGTVNGLPPVPVPAEGVMVPTEQGWWNKFSSGIAAGESGANINNANQMLNDATFNTGTGSNKGIFNISPADAKQLGWDPAYGKLTDPMIQNQLLALEGQVNANNLTGQGLPVAPGTLDVAHQQGFSGGVNMLEALRQSPDYPMTAFAKNLNSQAAPIQQAFNPPLGAGKGGAGDVVGAIEGWYDTAGAGQQTISGESKMGPAITEQGVNDSRQAAAAVTQTGLPVPVDAGINASRPEQYQTTGTLGGMTFEFGSGGRGKGSMPYGEHIITGYTSASDRTDAGNSYRHDSFELQDMFDSKIGQERDGMLIHQASTPNEISAGCLAVSSAQWPAFKAALEQQLAANGGQMGVTVGPQGVSFHPLGQTDPNMLQSGLRPPASIPTYGPSQTAADILGRNANAGVPDFGGPGDNAGGGFQGSAGPGQFTGPGFVDPNAPPPEQAPMPTSRPVGGQFGSTAPLDLQPGAGNAIGSAGQFNEAPAAPTPPASIPPQASPAAGPGPAPSADAVMALNQTEADTAQLEAQPLPQKSRLDQMLAEANPGMSFAEFQAKDYPAWFTGADYPPGGYKPTAAQRATLASANQALPLTSAWGGQSTSNPNVNIGPPGEGQITKPFGPMTNLAGPPGSVGANMSAIPLDESLQAGPDDTGFPQSAPGPTHPVPPADIPAGPSSLAAPSPGSVSSAFTEVGPQTPLASAPEAFAAPPGTDAGPSMNIGGTLPTAANTPNAPGNIPFAGASGNQQSAAADPATLAGLGFSDSEIEALKGKPPQMTQADDALNNVQEANQPTAKGNAAQIGAAALPEGVTMPSMSLAAQHAMNTPGAAGATPSTPEAQNKGANLSSPTGPIPGFEGDPLDQSKGPSQLTGPAAPGTDPRSQVGPTGAEGGTSPGLGYKFDAGPVSTSPLGASLAGISGAVAARPGLGAAQVRQQTVPLAGPSAGSAGGGEPGVRLQGAGGGGGGGGGTPPRGGDPQGEAHALAENLRTRGEIDLANAANGVITPSQQALIDIQSSNAKNALYQFYARQGRDPQNDTDFLGGMAQIEQQAVAQKQQFLQQLVTQGLQETGQSSTALTQLATLQFQEDNAFLLALSGALSSFGNIASAAVKLPNLAK